MSIAQVITWGEVAELETPVFALGRDGAKYTILNVQPCTRQSGRLNVTVLRYRDNTPEIFAIDLQQRVRVLVPDLGDALTALAAQFKIEFIEE
jgi:hypothetical protein